MFGDPFPIDPNAPHEPSCECRECLWDQVAHVDSNVPDTDNPLLDIAPSAMWINIGGAAMLALTAGGAYEAEAYRRAAGYQGTGDHGYFFPSDHTYNYPND